MNDEPMPVAEDAILLVDKPAGITSFGVVARVRRKLSEKAGFVTVKGKDGVLREKRKKVKVGHTGTLDPFATGLLIILTGKETKHANEFLKLDKEYIATIHLGAISTTGDLEGDKTALVDDALSTDALLALRTDSTVTRLSSLSAGRQFGNVGASSTLFSRPTAGRSATSPAYCPAKETSSDEMRFISKPTLEDVEHVVYSFVGEIEQQVPNFSAVKINGRRAYKLAREGKQVEMPTRKVKIYEIEILRYEWPELEIRCKVSSGTYIRALGEDIGKALNVGGYLTALRRTQVGNYRVEDAMKLVED